MKTKQKTITLSFKTKGENEGVQAFQEINLKIAQVGKSTWVDEIVISNYVWSDEIDDRDGEEYANVQLDETETYTRYGERWLKKVKGTEHHAGPEPYEYESEAIKTEENPLQKIDVNWCHMDAAVLDEEVDYEERPEEVRAFGGRDKIFRICERWVDLYKRAAAQADERFEHGGWDYHRYIHCWESVADALQNDDLENLIRQNDSAEVYLARIRRGEWTYDEFLCGPDHQDERMVQEAHALTKFFTSMREQYHQSPNPALRILGLR